MKEISCFNQEQDQIIFAQSQPIFKIVNADYELKTTNANTGDVAYSQHSGNIYCYINDTWTLISVSEDFIDGFIRDE